LYTAKTCLFPEPSSANKEKELEAALHKEEAAPATRIAASKLWE
jgi:hypothetical protein